jgi:1-acyl-sn-glycerol-3-phosphate acyltransferase
MDLATVTRNQSGETAEQPQPGEAARPVARSAGPASPDDIRPSALTSLQARLGRRLLSLIGTGLFRFKIQVEGLEHVPPGEPLIVAAAPHRGWLDSFLILIALPADPRIYYLGSAEAMFNTWWKRSILRLMGGVVPVSTVGLLNREGLETSLAILDGGNSLGLFPEGWGHINNPPPDIAPFKRGVAFLSQRSGRRVLPVGLAGTGELWRGKTVALRVGPPLPALAPGAGKAAQQAYVDAMREAIKAVEPTVPAPPPVEQRRWTWLSRMM